MNEVPQASWLQYSMLLGALAAGTVVSQLMPAYHEHVGTVTYPTRAAAARSNEAEQPGGYSHSKTPAPKLSIVRNSG